MGASVLAFAAGMVNAAGYLGFEHQALSHLTGTTSLGALAHGQGHLNLAAQLAGVMTSFVAGGFFVGLMLKDRDLSWRYVGLLVFQVALLLMASAVLTSGSSMDAHGFPGAFGQMAEDTNALVASHVEVQTNLARIMGRYAVGDLSENMGRLPGEKALLTQTMDEVKSNLSAMNLEIKQLAQSAANGDFTARGDAERFQYDFYVMVDSPHCRVRYKFFERA